MVLRTSWAIAKLNFFNRHSLGIVRVTIDTQVMLNDVIEEFLFGMWIMTFSRYPCEPSDLEDTIACSCLVCSLTALIVHKGLLMKSEEVKDGCEDC